jgi:hypothetical protein
MDTGSSGWLVIEDHIPDACEVLDLKAGDTLTFERRPTEWRGWIWCTDRQGIHGWVPENWVTIEGETCRARRDYTSFELTVRRGDVLTVEETESGWAWAANSRREKGWVPLKCLDRLPTDASQVKTDYVWYAGYGSNLSHGRFLCYILGGTPPFGRKRHAGCEDKTPPLESRALIIGHELYFALPHGHIRTENWGIGGVAFIEPEKGEEAGNICRMWKITRKQYEGVREQEGRKWYDKEISLGEVEGSPILTISHGVRLESVMAPSETYLKTMAAGLKEISGLSDDEIIDYLMGKPGIEGSLGRAEIEQMLAGIPGEPYRGDTP